MLIIGHFQFPVSTMLQRAVLFLPDEANPFIMFVLALYQVSQKLMVQGYSGHVRYKGGIDVVQKIMKSDGPRGLYRGFGLSVMTYAPSSAVWWASYGFSQRMIWRLVVMV